MTDKERQKERKVNFLSVFGCEIRNRERNKEIGKERETEREERKKER